MSRGRVAWLGAAVAVVLGLNAWIVCSRTRPAQARTGGRVVESDAYVSARPLPERLRAIDPVPPLLVVFGSVDALVPPASAARYERVPGAKVVTIDGVGHSPMLEAPERTLELIRGFP